MIRSMNVSSAARILAIMLRHALCGALAGCVLAGGLQDPAPSQVPAGIVSVVIRMVVGTDGRPFNPVIVRGSTSELDQKAIEAVRQWRFRPALQHGRPVPVVATVEVNFCLTGCPPGQEKVRVEQSSAPSRQEEQNTLLYWYVTQAQGGDLDAQVEASRRLSSPGTPGGDLVHAYAWATIAARRGKKSGSRLRAKLIKRMTPEQISAGDQMADHWKPGDPLPPHRAPQP